MAATGDDNNLALTLSELNEAPVQGNGNLALTFVEDVEPIVTPTVGEVNVVFTVSGVARRLLSATGLVAIKTALSDINPSRVLDGVGTVKAASNVSGQGTRTTEASGKVSIASLVAGSAVVIQSAPGSVKVTSSTSGYVITQKNAVGDIGVQAHVDSTSSQLMQVKGRIKAVSEVIGIQKGIQLASSDLYLKLGLSAETILIRNAKPVVNILSSVGNVSTITVQNASSIVKPALSVNGMLRYVNTSSGLIVPAASVSGEAVRVYMTSGSTSGMVKVGDVSPTQILNVFGNSYSRAKILGNIGQITSIHGTTMIVSTTHANIRKMLNVLGLVDIQSTVKFVVADPHPSIMELKGVLELEIDIQGIQEIVIDLRGEM